MTRVANPPLRQTAHCCIALLALSCAEAERVVALATAWSVSAGWSESGYHISVLAVIDDERATSMSSSSRHTARSRRSRSLWTQPIAHPRQQYMELRIVCRRRRAQKKRAGSNAPIGPHM